MKQRYICPDCFVFSLMGDTCFFLTTSPGLDDSGYNPDKGSETKGFDDFYDEEDAGKLFLSF